MFRPVTLPASVKAVTAFVVTLAGLMAVFAAPAQGEAITAARYEDPTTRYDHGVLGDDVESGTLVMETDGGRRLRITLPQSRVFEDIAPRLADLDGDGAPEVIVVETDMARGARLSVYGINGGIAATPYIGSTHRWLAPIGAADLDGDGKVEVAYVDRPHLAKTIRIWRFESGALVPVVDLPGFTNHRIGENTIAGGIRDCGNGPEMIVADGDWRRIMAIGYQDGTYRARALGPHRDRSSFAAALACR